MTTSTWTGADVRFVRELLGLSAAKFAAKLGLGKNGGRTVRRWEAGATITLRTQRQIEALGLTYKPGYVFVGRGSFMSAEIVEPDHQKFTGS